LKGKPENHTGTGYAIHSL